jgi:hypothetical protein
LLKKPEMPIGKRFRLNQVEKKGPKKGKIPLGRLCVKLIGERKIRCVVVARELTVGQKLVSPTHFGLPQYLTALIKKNTGYVGEQKN